MKLIFYGANIILFIVLASVAMKLKSNKSNALPVIANLTESGDPVIEDIKRTSDRSIDYGLIPKKSIFHKDRKMSKKESDNESEILKAMKNKVFLLQGIVKVGEEVAVIAIMDKKDLESSLKSSDKLKKLKGEIYKVGDQLEGTLYKLDSVVLGEKPYVVLAYNTLKIKVFQFSHDKDGLTKAVRQKYVAMQEKKRPQAIRVDRPFNSQEIEEIRRRHNEAGQGK